MPSNSMEIDDDVPPEMDRVIDIEKEEENECFRSAKERESSRQPVVASVDPLDAFMASIHKQVDGPTPLEPCGVFGKSSVSADLAERQKNDSNEDESICPDTSYIITSCDLDSCKVTDRKSKRKGKANAGHACFLCAEQKPKMKRCSRCKKAYYCSLRCQKLHYRAHRRVCRAIGAEGQLKDQLAALSVVEKCKVRIHNSLIQKFSHGGILLSGSKIISPVLRFPRCHSAICPVLPIIFSVHLAMRRIKVMHYLTRGVLGKLSRYGKTASGVVNPTQRNTSLRLLPIRREN